MSQVTVREAALLTGKSRETINSATKDGTLSFSLNGRNHKVVDVSELGRVYPLVKSIDQMNEESTTVKKGPDVPVPDVSIEVAILKEKLTHSEAMQTAVVAERERERRQFEAEIESLRTSLEKAQDQHKTLLQITNQSSTTKQRVGDWESTVNDLETKIANQESSLEERLLELRKQAKQEAICEIKDKYWWQLLFGS